MDLDGVLGLFKLFRARQVGFQSFSRGFGRASPLLSPAGQVEEEVSPTRIAPAPDGHLAPPFRCCSACTSPRIPRPHLEGLSEKPPARRLKAPWPWCHGAPVAALGRRRARRPRRHGTGPWRPAPPCRGSWRARGATACRWACGGSTRRRTTRGSEPGLYRAFERPGWGWAWPKR